MSGLSLRYSNSATFIALLINKSNSLWTGLNLAFNLITSLPGWYSFLRFIKSLIIAWLLGLLLMKLLLLFGLLSNSIAQAPKISTSSFFSKK